MIQNIVILNSTLFQKLTPLKKLCIQAVSYQMSNHPFSKVAERLFLNQKQNIFQIFKGTPK